MDWQIKRRADLARGAEAAAKPASIRPLAYPGDGNAHEWVVTVTDNGAYVDLSGVTVTGYFYRHADGATPFATGTVTGNTVSVQIPSAAYALGGYVTGILRAAKGDVLMTLDCIVFAVGPNVTGEIIDPGTVIQDIDALIAAINSAVESIPEDYTALEDDVQQLRLDLSEAVTRSGRVICIDDALAGLEPVSVSEGGAIFGRNFGQLNATSYTGYGVTFAVDSGDPNTVTVTGTATGANAYSFGSITAQTARIRVPAGTYYLRVFSDDLGEQNVNLYVNDVTANRVAYIGPANTPTALTFDQETQLGVRFQVPQNSAVSATLRFFFGAVEADEYEPYYAESQSMHRHSTVLFESTAGEIEYCAHITDHREEIAVSDAAEIFDAVDGAEAVSLPASAVVYSRNMYRANIANRTVNGITFRQGEDLNTVRVSGTATAAAFSHGTVVTRNTQGVITTINANLLPAGVYYVAFYSDNYTDSTEAMYRARINTLVASSEAENYVDMIDHCHKLTLTEPTWVAVRLWVREGATVDDRVHLYISKYLPLPEYAPYAVPNRRMKRYSIVEGLNGGSMTYYKRQTGEGPVDIRVATFNVGEYSRTNPTPDVPDAMDAYMAYISSLDAALLCTQEDRILYDPNATPPVKVYDVFYRYLYGHSEVGAYATSTKTLTGLRRVVSNLKLSPSGRFVFTDQGTDQEHGGTFWSSFTYSGLLINGRHILLINTHLAPKDYNASVRLSQITEMLDFIAACGVEDVVICGDLNTWASGELDALRTAGYVLANYGLYGAIPTWQDGILAFDNICVKSDHIKMRGVQAVPNDLNDHYALTATLTVI